VAAEITQLLQHWADGEPAALERLWPLVYDELRKLARRQLRRQQAQTVLQPTVLVHEAWLRLFRQKPQPVAQSWAGRVQFYAFAARVMRSVLIDHVRQQQAEKRGGSSERLSLTAAQPESSERPVELLALDEALQRLSTLHPQQGQIVELRFFGGLTIEETAHTLGVSHATVERGWQAARAWLYGELSQ
jgi:RNA polymerase sigma factor (TIGR02999 family)